MEPSTVLKGAVTGVALAFVITSTFQPAAAREPRPPVAASAVTDPRKGTMHDLGGLPSQVSDINDRGEIAGSWGGLEEHDERALLFSGGRWHEISRGTPSDLNERGEVTVNQCWKRGCEALVVWLGGRRILPIVPTDYEFPSAATTAINDLGEVIGSSNWTGVRWVGDTITDLGFDPAAINETGQIAGRSIWSEEAPFSRAVLWTDGHPQILGSLGGRDSTAVDVNEKGQVVGTSELADGTSHAFLWSRDRLRDLGTLGGRYSRATAVNDRGQVIGVSQTADGTLHGFLWSKGKMRDLGTLGGAETEPTDLDDKGNVVGWSETAAGTRHAFLWRRGRMYDLGTLGGANSSAVAINNRGEIVGMSDHPDGDAHAFVWSRTSPK